MHFLSNAPAFMDSLRNGVDLASNLTVIGGTIGFVIAFWALARGA